MSGSSPVCRVASRCHTGGEEASQPWKGTGHTTACVPGILHPGISRCFPHGSTSAGPGYFLTSLGKARLGFPMCADPLSLLVAAVLEGHGAESLHREQTDRQADDPTAGKLSQRFVRIVFSCETLRASKEAFNS